MTKDVTEGVDDQVQTRLDVEQQILDVTVNNDVVYDVDGAVTVYDVLPTALTAAIDKVSVVSAQVGEFTDRTKDQVCVTEYAPFLVKVAVKVIV